MIRILHTADWHLGQTFFGYDRTQEHEHFLDWLAGVLTKNKIDVLIVAGDVFDVSNPSAASQRMFYRFIHRVTTENPRLQLVVVAGNHDSAALLIDIRQVENVDFLRQIQQFQIFSDFSHMRSIQLDRLFRLIANFQQLSQIFRSEPPA